ncbi:MAG: anti-sigma factor antagonist [Spirochaetes bacterium]|nr:anti-sigma factor antagonist [Spirochaetota bacterium]MBN2770459.1 anti-sigma factor antagonist [Spirochaetota bacterium]
MEFSYVVEDYEYFKLIKLSGNLSVISAEEFERAVNKITATHSVIIDCANMEILTSAGVDSFVNVSLNARDTGRRVMILHLDPDYYHLIETLNILDYLIIVETLDEGRVKIEYYT